MPGRPKLRRFAAHVEEMGGDDVVFDQIAAGKTMKEIAKSFHGCIPQDPEFPSPRTLYRWRDLEKEERTEKWAEAQKIAAHGLVEEAEEIVENRGPDGEPMRPVDSAELGWLKARAELRRKRAADWNPEEYGEKQEQGVNINVDLGQLYLGALRQEGQMDLAPGRKPEMLEAEVVEDAE